MKSLKSRKNITISGLVALLLTVDGCGSITNQMNDISRNVSKRNYHVTLYSANGDTILDSDIKNTYIRVDENGSGVRYVENGKTIMINGTYIIKEK